MQQAGAQQPLHDVAHRAVVWQPHPLSCTHEAAQAGERSGGQVSASPALGNPNPPPTAASTCFPPPTPSSPGPWAHLESKASAQAEPGPTGSEPELDCGHLKRREPLVRVSHPNSSSGHPEGHP